MHRFRLVSRYISSSPQFCHQERNRRAHVQLLFATGLLLCLHLTSYTTIPPLRPPCLKTLMTVNRAWPKTQTCISASPFQTKNALTNAPKQSNRFHSPPGLESPSGEPTGQNHFAIPLIQFMIYLIYFIFPNRFINDIQ